MKKLFLAFITFLLIQLTSLAQAPDTMWTKTFDVSEMDEGLSVQQTSDGGYIITGCTGDTFAYDLLIIKTDSSGDILWTRTYGDSDIVDLGSSVQQTEDGGYIISGYTGSFFEIGNGDSDMWLIKTNSLGDTLWTRTYGDSATDYGRFVQQTADKGFIITGCTNSFGAGEDDVWLIKVNSSGDTLWTRTYGGSYNDRGKCVQQTTDSGYIIIGDTQTFGAGDNDVWLIKSDAYGDTLWTKTFGGNTYDVGYFVQQTNDNGYIVAGGTSSFGIGCDVWLIKTDSLGDTLWTKTFGGSNWDHCCSVQQTKDGGFILTGLTRSFGSGNSDIWVIKTDTYGDSIWTKVLGTPENEYGNYIKQTVDLGYIIIGTIGYEGTFESDVWLIKIAPDTGLVSIEDNNSKYPTKYVLYEAFPNPFNPSTKIRYSIPQSSRVIIKIYDLLGKEIETLVNEEKPIGTYELTWNAANLPSGVYFYQIGAGSFVETKKIVLMK